MLGLGNSLSTLKKNLVFRDNYSISFDGTDNYIDVNRVANDIDVAVGTISMWVKLSTVSTTGTFIKARKDADNHIGLIYHASTNQIRISYKGEGSNSVAATGTLGIEDDGAWHHIAATWDIAADQLKLYLNAGLVTTTTGLTQLDGAVSACDIGQNTEGGGFYEGNIGDVAIFTRVVRIEDLLGNIGGTVVNAGPKDLIAIQDGLIGYWKFEEGSGTSANDNSSKTNHGTLTNSPTWSTDTPR